MGGEGEFPYNSSEEASSPFPTRICSLRLLLPLVPHPNSSWQKQEGSRPEQEGAVKNSPVPEGSAASSLPPCLRRWPCRGTGTVSAASPGPPRTRAVCYQSRRGR